MHDNITSVHSFNNAFLLILNVGTLKINISNNMLDKFYNFKYLDFLCHLGGVWTFFK